MFRSSFAPRLRWWGRHSSLPSHAGRQECLPHRRARTFVPRLEVLEDRTILSTITVTNANDSGPGSLRDAIAIAPSGSVIEFDKSLKGSTITLTTGQLAISKNLDIEGLGADMLAISGNDSSRVFIIDSGAIVTITGLTIAHGRAAVTTHVPSASIPLISLGGGIFNDGGAVTLSDVTFAENSAVGVAPTFTSSGGAVANVGSGASMTVDHCAFIGNKATGAVGLAGAIADLFGAQLAISQSLFVRDVAVGAVLAAGGAIGNDGGSRSAVQHCAFLDDQAVALLGANPLNIFQGHAVGGAIANSGGSQLTVSRSIMERNDAIGGNGSGSFATGGEGDGGAVVNSDVSPFSPAANSIVTLVRDTFVQNLSHGGNGANAASGTGASGGNGVGGAVVNISAELVVVDSTFFDNQAIGGQGGSGRNGGAGGLGRGAAIHNTFAVPIAQSLEVTNSIFIDNQATGGAGGAGGSGGNGGPGGAAEGGAVRFLFGNLSLTKSIIVGNQAAGGAGGSAGAGGLGGTGGAALGGGIAIGLAGFSATATVSNCAIADNLALGGPGGLGGGNGGDGLGGGIFVATGTTLCVLDSIVAGNKAQGGDAGSGGSAGQGIGGGIYITAGVIVGIQDSHVVGNKASTSNDDSFGVFSTSC